MSDQAKARDDARDEGPAEAWDAVIRPTSGWLNVDIIGVWRYRDLLGLLVWRDFISIYKQTLLGPIWFLLQPIATALVFTVIFGKVAQIPTDGVPPFLFYMSGIVPWAYFAGCLTKTSDTFIGNAGIFGKVYFPRLVTPVSVILTNLISFALQLILFIGFVVYFFMNDAAIQPTWWLLAVPFLVVQLALLGLGIGILLSSLTTRYRDLTFALGFGVQLWMYATPIVYPTSQIPEAWRWLLMLNPMAPIVDCFRYAFLGAGSVHPEHMLLSIVITALALIAGVVVFNRVERTFIDTV